MGEGLNTVKNTNYPLGTKPQSLLWPILFMLVLVIGLFYVKWDPYYHKAFTAAAKHSIGVSIITGEVAAAPEPSWSAALDYAAKYFKAVWKAVILALLLGSLVQVLLPRDWIKRMLGSTGFGSTAVAGAAALPAMMCSCCAGPVTVGLRKSSASPGAALAFFLANPVLNPATIIFMGFVLSWKFALFRIVAGIILVFGIAALVNKLADSGEIPDSLIKEEIVSNEDGNLFIRWLRALGQLIVDTIPAYLFVVLLLGAFRAWLFPALDPAWANGILAIIGLAITGTLFAIPTAAEIPIVQTLMSFGLGAGPATTLMMTLPAVSLPSLLIIKRAFPTKILVLVAAAVALTGIISGLVAMVIL